MTKKEKYIKEHKSSNIKVGDKVKVLKKANTKNGWDNTWVIEMNNAIGKIYNVEEDNLEFGFELGCSHGCDDSNYEFPHFVLERVEEEYV